jgi:hypothetical protein
MALRVHAAREEAECTVQLPTSPSMMMNMTWLVDVSSNSTNEAEETGEGDAEDVRSGRRRGSAMDEERQLSSDSPPN